MREKIFTLLGILITWISIFFVVPLMGFEIRMWVLIVSAFIGGLFVGVIVLLRETVIENIIMVVTMVVTALVLAGEFSGTKPELGFVFISALLSGVIGIVTNQINQYAANNIHEMDIEIIRSIESPDGKRKVEIFKRSNGSYGFEDMKYGDEEECWFPVGRYSVGIFETEEEAINEAKGRVNWLASIAR